MKQNKGKGIVLAIILIVVAVVGISNLHFQSASSYKKSRTVYEGEDGHKIIIENDAQEVAVVSNNAIVTATVLPTFQPIEKNKTAKPQKTKEAVKTKKATQKPTERKDNQKKAKSSESPKSKVDKDKDNKDKKNNSNKEQPKKKENGKTDENTKKYLTCTISIQCTSLLDKKDSIDDKLWKYIPDNGIILPATRLSVEEGTNVYEALAAACQKYQVALDAEYSKMFGTTYVKGIGHLYEKNAGNMSGWLYLVNDKIPNVGASKYEISEGDVIIWGYTCDGRSM